MSNTTDRASLEDRVEARLIQQAMRDGFEGEEAVACGRAMKGTMYASHVALGIVVGDAADNFKQAMLSLRNAALKGVKR